MARSAARRRRASGRGAGSNSGGSGAGFGRWAAESAGLLLIVLSALMGAVLLLAADTLARWLIAPQELPVGVLTAVLGGGYLLYLMHRRSPSRGGL
jgi:hypothetical protein